MKEKPKYRPIKLLKNTSLGSKKLKDEFYLNPEKALSPERVVNSNNIEELDEDAVSENAEDLQSVVIPIQILNPINVVKKRYIMSSSDLINPENEPRVIDQILKTFEFHFGMYFQYFPKI